MNVGDTPAQHLMYQASLKQQLKMGLSSLPQPKNDYEIVVPDHEDQTIPEQAQGIFILNLVSESELI